LRQIGFLGVETQRARWEANGDILMCDYSLQSVASRPAKVGDRLVSSSFSDAVTRGFAAADDRDVAVCLLPGTEVAFEQQVEYDNILPFLPKRRIPHKVARFRQINRKYAQAHHDALEFPNGKVVLLNSLREGQSATVIQLSALARREGEALKSAQLEPPQSLSPELVR
jgi:hypothetical protein